MNPPIGLIVVGLLFILALIAGAGLIVYIVVGGAAAAAGVLGAELHRHHAEAAANRVLEQALAERLASIPIGYQRPVEHDNGPVVDVVAVSRSRRS